MTEQQLQEVHAQSEHAAIEGIKDQLTAFFQKYATIAGQSLDKVRFMFIVSLAAACWLTFYFGRLFNYSLLGTIPVFLVLVLPALLMLKLYLTLTDVMTLPDQVQQMLENMKGKTLTTRKQILDRLPETGEMEKKRGRLKDLFAMSKSLIEIKHIAGDISGISGAFVGALLLASPVFLILIVLSGALIGILAFLSLMTGLLFIF